jgi:DNA polymerase (family 10)
MDNPEFAKVFWEIAELLELKDENRFKIRAYQKAAQNIENLSEELSDVYRKGGLKALQDIPGIGEHIALKIEELIRTGRQKDHQQLLKEFPRGFIEVMRVPGIGP